MTYKSEQNTDRKDLLCWAEPFGFGPSAAINLFAPYLPGPSDFAGTTFTCDLQSPDSFRHIINCDTLSTSHGIKLFLELCQKYKTVFIACDMKAAELSVAAGCRTLLYDPIPWFWRGKLPDICHQVCAYICQDFFGVRERIKREKVTNAIVVPPLLPQEAKTKNTTGVLVNLGGLQNPYMHLGECQHYAQLILDKVAVSSTQHHSVLGKYFGYSSRAVTEGVRNHPFFTGQPKELRKQLATSRVAFMTPGLGNIYDAAVLGDLICFLPPLNDSQGQQLNQLRNHGLTPFSIDWHELLEDIDPIDYSGKNQELIMKEISYCLHQLLKNPQAKARLSKRIQAVIHEATSTKNQINQPLKKLIEHFDSSKKAEEEVGTIAHQVATSLKSSVNLQKKYSLPLCNQNIDDPTIKLQELHNTLNGTGFNTLSFMIDFISHVYNKHEKSPSKENWQKAINDFKPNIKTLFNTYGSSYCTSLAEIFREAARNELGIEGEIVYVDYQESKRPLHRVWKDYRGPVHTDIMFQYQRKGTNKTEVIHIICGLGNDLCRFKHFSAIDDHHRFLSNGNYRFDPSGNPQTVTDTSSFYKQVLTRWDFVEIVKGPKVTKESTRFCVDMIRGTMTLKDKKHMTTYFLDNLKDDALTFMTHIQKEFAQPKSFIDSMKTLAELRHGFVQHILGDSCSHLEDALRNLQRNDLGWVETFDLKSPSKNLEQAIEIYLKHPSYKKISEFMSYLSKSSKIWLGMQTKAPAQQDFDILLLQSAVMLNHHVVTQREKIFEGLAQGIHFIALLKERLDSLPKKETLVSLAQKSDIFSTYEDCLQFVEHTQEILIDHLLLAFIEADITSTFKVSELNNFKESFATHIKTQLNLAKRSQAILLNLLDKILELETSIDRKEQTFSTNIISTNQINTIECYYWDTIPVRAALRELPQSTRAFSVAAQVSVFESTDKLKTLLGRLTSSSDKNSAALVMDRLFNHEMMKSVRRYEGVGLGPQITSLCLDVAHRCGLIERFQSEALIGFDISPNCRPEDLTIKLKFVERIAHLPILRRILAKNWNLPLSIDAEGLLNQLTPELILNLFHSRFLGEFLELENTNLIEVLAELLTRDDKRSPCTKKCTLKRHVDRAIIDTLASSRLQTPLIHLRQSIHELESHPFNTKKICSWIHPLNSFDYIAQLQEKVDNRLKKADDLWSDTSIKEHLSDMRGSWISQELPYYEPNCVTSVIPHTFNQTDKLQDHERQALSFYEHVRMFWQNPYAVSKVLQRLTCLHKTYKRNFNIDDIPALEKLLETAEKEMGFNTIKTLEKGFSPEDFYAVLHRGHPFNDLIFLSQPHGCRVHRLQWLILYIHYQHEPQKLGLSQNTPPGYLGDAYRLLGDETFIKKLGYPLNQTKEDIWRLLFDTLHQRNFSCADHVMRVLTKHLGFNPDEVSPIRQKTGEKL